MKTSYIFCLLTAFSFFSFSSAQAQYDDAKVEKYPKNVIRINPLSLIVNNYSLFYERALNNEEVSLQMGVNYMTNTWSTGTRIDGTEYSGTLKNRGWGLTPEVRYYFLRDITKQKFKQPAPYGVYVAGFGRYMRNDFTFNFKANNINEDLKFRTQVYAVGATIGAQGIIGKVVALDIFIGPDINYVSGKIVEYPEIKLFEGDEIEWIDPNIITNLMLKYVAKANVSTTFPAVRAGISAGIAF